MADDNEAHSSYAVWLVYVFRAIEKILPALKGKSKYGWVPAFLLCFVTLLALLGIGIYFDGYVLHPPTVYNGRCPSPAFIRGIDCKQIITVTAINSASSTITTTQTVTAGSIIGLAK